MDTKPHTKEDNATKHITPRIPNYVVTALESDSVRLGISVNSLSNNILKKWARWDRHVQKLEMLAVPKDVVAAFVPDYDEKQVYDLVDSVMPFFQEAVILIKGKYDLKRCIETLDDYMKSTGIASDHTMDGSTHCFTIQHGMGNSWSVFIKVMLGRLFSEFVSDKKVEYDVHENIISVRVSLGSEWDEHDY